MHSLSFGVSGLQKEYLWHMVSDENRIKSAMKPIFGAFRFLTALKGTFTVHSILNRFPAESHTGCIYSALSINIRTPEHTDYVNGLFMRTRVAGVIDDSDNEAIHIVFPFLAAFDDQRCDLHETTFIPRVIRNRTDKVSFVHRQYWCTALSEENHGTLCHKIKFFKV